MSAGKKNNQSNQPNETQLQDQANPTTAADDAANSTDQDLIQIINDQQAKITELTNLVQRTRADFENYRKHTEADLERSRQRGEESVARKLLPIIDVLDTAMSNVPDDLSDNAWAKGIVGAHKNLAKMLTDLKLERQSVAVGDVFDYNQYEAILNDGGDGDQEVVAEILRPGYLYDGRIIRPAMVKVAKK